MKEYDTLEATLRFHEQLVEAIVRLADARLAPYHPTATEKQILEYSAQQVAEAKRAYYEACKREHERLRSQASRPAPWANPF